MAKRPPGSKSQPEDSPVPEQPGTELPQSNPEKKPFVPEILDKTVIAVPLLEILRKEDAALEKDPQLQPRAHPVIIDLNLEYPGGRKAAKEQIQAKILEAIENVGRNKDPKHQGINQAKSRFSEQYLFGKLEGAVIRELVRLDNHQPLKSERGSQAAIVQHRAIYRVWPDFKVGALIHKSISTVKVDAARNAFAAYGDGIVWAVMDSGIDGSHPHFKQYDNLNVPFEHCDFTGEEQPLVDGFGHGTHVAGIVAGQLTAKQLHEINRQNNPDSQANDASTEDPGILAYARQRDEFGDVTYESVKLDYLSGMAPKAKLLSLKVLDENGDGLASNLITAINYIQEINGYGRRIRIHGVNMSVGYDFEPEWFACGQSPLCIEVDRLVRSGVVVVVAAGNTGYGWSQTAFRGMIAAGIDLTINDPGNAELAITVGATHRTAPHIYGVSYFSSKGPTGDGRAKPDLVAPGEKILSCAAGKRRQELKDKAGDCHYLEESGTSMAAPHVSGVIAAFLSARQEFVGQPERVKEIFLSTATDLKRDRYFQGHGLVDMMRAIQSV